MGKESSHRARFRPRRRVARERRFTASRRDFGHHVVVDHLYAADLPVAGLHSIGDDLPPGAIAVVSFSAPRASVEPGIGDAGELLAAPCGPLVPAYRGWIGRTRCRSWLETVPSWSTGQRVVFPRRVPGKLRCVGFVLVKVIRVVQTRWQRVATVGACVDEIKR
jgi:hypothetical protein